MPPQDTERQFNYKQKNSLAFSPQPNYTESDRHLLAKFSANFCR
jgi:hypothetical protein